MKRASAFQIELEFESVGFFKERGKLEYNKLNTYIWRRRQDSNPGHIGGGAAVTSTKYILGYPSQFSGT